MFDTNIKLYGKHATYVKFLAKKTQQLQKDFFGAEVFNRYIDVYKAGIIIGLVKHLKVDLDNYANAYTANIMAETVIAEQNNLTFLYRLCMLLDNKDLSADDRVDLAFKFDNDPERTREGMAVFNAYARGGIEWLYDAFTDDATTKEDFLDKIHEIVIQFNEDYNLE